ncbi:SH3 domain-containing protein [Mesobacterium pallidum]|uniref:SH3 domain-containing protein n=1 Tax=Mesobacterium pallidum TaxID=2872037 RepID=UPI001EE31E04|nr:SH3 domain-containing protein [Mesobacterium pallidum]
MIRPIGIALSALVLVAGCSAAQSVTGTRTTVQRVGEGDMLKLRAGPGLGYRVLLGLPDGTELVRHDCVTEIGQAWCKVSLAGAPGVTGYVAGDYIDLP